MNFSRSLSALGSWIIDSPWLVGVLLKITVLLTIAWLMHALMARANPRWRVVLWRTAAVGLVAVWVTSALPMDLLEIALASPTTESAKNATPEASFYPPSSNTSQAANGGVAAAMIHTSETVMPPTEPWTNIAPEAAVTTVPETVKPWPLGSIAISIWCTGVLIGALRFVAGRRRLAHLVAASCDPPAAVVELAKRIGDSMGARGQVRSSNLVHSPIVCRSSLGPTLLIPQRLIASSSQPEMAAILTHEFAHLQGRDLGWNVCIRMISTLLWPHPLVWRMPMAHVTACEYAADAESARRLGDPAVYVQTLAKVALAAANTSPLPALAMARLSNVRKRLQRVNETFRFPPLGRRRVLASMSVMVSATIGLGCLQLVRAQAPATTATTDSTVETEANTSAGRTITIRIVDAENNPLENAILKAIVYIKDAKYESPDDAIVEPKSLGAGRFEVAVADGAQAIQLKASSPGLVPMSAMWQGDEVDNEFPHEFTFTLPPGTRISGRVLTEQGAPIENATVSLLVITDKSTRQQVDLYSHLVKTDATGTWACEVMPAKFNGVWIRLTHPDYASDNVFGETAGQVSIDDVRSGKHSMVMKKGVTVEGSVVDNDSKPIAGATVYQGSDRFGTSFPETKTDEAGRFSFANSKSGEMVLTIVAKGYAPELKVVQIDAQTQPIAISLPPSKRLRVRTLDADGKPLGGVMIAPDTWRGHRSLADLDVPRESDAEGYFEWTDAPADEIRYSILKQGWLDHRDLAIKPTDAVIEIKLLRPLVVTGNVTDANTGKPIEKFTVLPGFKWDQSERITWERQDAIRGGEGKYVLRFDYPRPTHVFQVEATGYEPVQSRGIQSNEGELSLDFALKPAKQITGTVVTPTGEPAAIADVVMALPNMYVSIFNGRMQDARDQPFVITDEQGMFNFPSQKDAFKLIALHDSGVAVIDGRAMQEGQTIKLVPWAKIIGTAKIGSRPAAQTELNLWHSDTTPFNEPRFQITGRARADAEGRFEFTRVLPDAEFQVSRILPLAEGPGEIYTHGVNVNTIAGSTQEITIGGNGRPVVGRIVVPNTDRKYVWSAAMLTGNPVEFAKPEGYEDWSNEQRESWFKEWSKTEAGQAYSAQFDKRYALNPQADGSFRVDDVPAGRYNVQASIAAAPERKNGPFGEPLGNLNRTITVPEMAGGRSDEPLDIGEMTIRLRKFLNIGDAAPELTAETVDGKPIALADLRGKYVLVDFWATWCGPCLAELPTLEKLKSELGDRDDFVILGLNMDNSVADAKKYLDEHPHDWLQAHIAPDRIEEVQHSFGIIGIPATFVFSPEGKLLAKDLRGDAFVKQLVELLPK